MSANEPAANAAGWIGRFRRITTTGLYLPEVDGLRFISIALVVLHHLHGHVTNSFPLRDDALATIIGRVADIGNLGVQIFFSISGFILGLPFAQQYLKGGSKVELGVYYMRRITRIEPPYMIAMCLAFLAQLSRPQYTTAELFPHFAASLGYVHNFCYGFQSPVNPVAWSLEVEVQFYILAPWLARVFCHGAIARRFGLICCIFLVTFLSQHHWFILGPDFARLAFFSIIEQIPYFLIGFLAADLYVSQESRPESMPAGRSFVGIIALLLIPCVYTLPTGWLLFPAALFVLFWTTLRGGVLTRLLSHPVVSVLGGMCYTIYLIHLPVMACVIGFSKRWVVSLDYLPNLLVQAAIIVPSVFIASAAFYLLIEKPCMNRAWPSLLLTKLRARSGR